MSEELNARIAAAKERLLNPPESHLLQLEYLTRRDLYEEYEGCRNFLGRRRQTRFGKRLRKKMLRSYFEYLMAVKGELHCAGVPSRQS